MTPSADQSFFAASMGAAAALLGLLFVAVSVAPERTVGAGAPVERQMLAESVFTALVDAFFVSMGGTLSDLNLGWVAFVVSAFGLVQTLQVGWRLWPHQFAVRSAFRRLALVGVALAIYGLQFGYAYQFVRAPGLGAPVVPEINLLFALYAFALGRSWQLLGARRGLLSGLLNPAFEDEGNPAEISPRSASSPPTDAPGVSRKGPDAP